MWHGFYKRLAPKGQADFLFKMLLFCCCITLMNYAFNLYYPGAPSLSFKYLIMNSVAVGGPFVLLFFLILTKQVSLQRTLVQLSRFDSLTNLPNRRFFLKRSEAAIRENDSSVLLILDVDHFKRVNDTWGHSVGDECLRSVGHILARLVRSDDVVGRLGGEEFAILLHNTKLQNVDYIVSSLLRPFPFSAGGDLQHLSVTVSIGACEITRGGDLALALVAADNALYKAKENGRACMEIAA